MFRVRVGVRVRVGRSLCVSSCVRLRLGLGLWSG